MPNFMNKNKYLEPICKKLMSTFIITYKKQRFWINLTVSFSIIQFGTQVKFRCSRDHNNRSEENAFSVPWYYSEMELEPVAG